MNKNSVEWKRTCQFIDLAKEYYDIKNSHYNLFTKNAESASDKKIFDDYVSSLRIEKICKKKTERYLKDIRNSLLFDTSWNAGLPRTFLDLLILMNCYNQEKYKTNIKYDSNDLVNLDIVLFAYLKFITFDEDVMCKYKASCNNYYSPIKDITGRNKELIYNYRKKMQDNIYDFFAFILYDSTAKSEKKILKGKNNQSIKLNIYEYMVCFILFSMFDINPEFSKFLRNKQFNMLKSYERELILFLSFYICQNREQYDRVTEQMWNPLKFEIDYKIKLIFQKICFLDEEKQVNNYKMLLKKLESFESKYLNPFLKDDYINQYTIDLLGKDVDKEENIDENNGT